MVINWDHPNGSGEPTETLTRAAQYVRMSTEHQKYSTDNQSAAIKRYAAKRAFEIVRTYADEGKSGLKLDGRDALKQLLSDIENRDLRLGRVSDDSTLPVGGDRHAIRKAESAKRIGFRFVERDDEHDTVLIAAHPGRSPVRRDRDSLRLSRNRDDSRLALHQWINNRDRAVGNVGDDHSPSV